MQGRGEDTLQCSLQAQPALPVVSGQRRPLHLLKVSGQACEVVRQHEEAVPFMCPPGRDCGAGGAFVPSSIMGVAR